VGSAGWGVEIEAVIIRIQDTRNYIEANQIGVLAFVRIAAFATAPTMH
jgi:hypothetical protein